MQRIFTFPIGFTLTSGIAYALAFTQSFTERRSLTKSECRPFAQSEQRSQSLLQLVALPELKFNLFIELQPFTGSRRSQWLLH